MQLSDEVHELADFFVGGEKLEASARQKAGQAFELVYRLVERALGQFEHAACNRVVDLREVLMNVDRTSERHERSDPLGRPVRSQLVGEHPSLRVTNQVHIMARRVAQPVDGVVHRGDVIV